MLRWCVVAIALLLATACDASCAARPASAARPNVIVFGGGWGPEGTQASIEGHVKSLSTALVSRKPIVLFAAGPNKTLPAVQEVDDVDEASAILGDVFDRPRDLHVRYRPTKLAPVNRANKVTLLSTIESSAGANPLVVFGAGHGAKATDETPAALEMWGPADRISARDITEAIDRAKPKAAVALVLGQCHSGAMHDVVFEGANPKRAVATPARCVLAAVPADLEAAGCTADVNDPSAPAYLAQIARALGNRSADYDGDGKVGLHEAHAFASIHDPTVDVPVRSSELYVASILGDAIEDPSRYSMDDIRKSASPARRAVLTSSLPSSFDRAEPAAIVGAFTAVDERIKIASGQLDEALEAKEQSRRTVLDALLSRWPELANPYHHRARALLAGDAKEVIDFVKVSPAYARLVKQQTIVSELDHTLLKLEKRAARLERWLRTAQYVLDARAVRKQNDRRVVDALEAMLRCERIVL